MPTDSALIAFFDRSALTNEPFTTCADLTLLRGTSAFVAAADVPPSTKKSASSARW
jgi:hypothetical protein